MPVVPPEQSRGSSDHDHSAGVARERSDRFSRGRHFLGTGVREAPNSAVGAPVPEVASRVSEEMVVLSRAGSRNHLPGISRLAGTCALEQLAIFGGKDDMVRLLADQ